MGNIRSLAADEPASGDDELFRLVYPALRRYAAVVGSLSDDPDDLVQEAVSRTLARGDLASLDNPVAYLRRAISNLVIDNARSDKVKDRQLLRVASDSSSADAYPSDLAELERLSAVERAVVYLVDVEGLGFSEAASIVGITPVAARLRASRARRKLRESLLEDT